MARVVGSISASFYLETWRIMPVNCLGLQGTIIFTDTLFSRCYNFESNSFNYQKKRSLWLKGLCAYNKDSSHIHRLLRCWFFIQVLQHFHCLHRIKSEQTGLRTVPNTSMQWSILLTGPSVEEAPFTNSWKSPLKEGIIHHCNTFIFFHLKSSITLSP